MPSRRWSAASPGRAPDRGAAADSDRAARARRIADVRARTGRPRPARAGCAAASSRSDTGAPCAAPRCASAAPTSDRRPRSPTRRGATSSSDLPAGRFNLSVSKSGFVTMQYGQNRPFEPGRPIELADAQMMDKADVALPRGSVAVRPRPRRVRRAGRRRQRRRDAHAVRERPAAARERRPEQRRRTISASSACTACRPASTTSAPRCDRWTWRSAT